MSKTLNMSGGGAQEAPVISISSSGLITATAGDEKATKQLSSTDDADFVESNIKSGVTIFGKTGSFAVGSYIVTAWTEASGTNRLLFSSTFADVSWFPAQDKIVGFSLCLDSRMSIEIQHSTTFVVCGTMVKENGYTRAWLYLADGSTVDCTVSFGGEAISLNASSGLFGILNGGGRYDLTLYCID